MGFISSILCCSSDSSQATSKWDNRQLNPRSQQLQGQKEVSNKVNLYSTKGMSTSTNSNSNTIAASNYNHQRQGQRSRPQPNNSASSGRFTRQSSPKNSTDKQEPQRMETRSKKRDSGINHNDGTSFSSVNSTPKTNEKLDRAERSSMRSKDEIREKEEDTQAGREENEKVQELQNHNSGPDDVEKQGVYVYAGDTDTSTGGSSYDHHSQLPKSTTTTTTTTTTNPNQLSQTPDLQETTTTVQEGENVSSSADDTDVPLNQSKSHQEEVDPDMDVDVSPPYEDDEEFVDLTELQLGQYHAAGYNTLLPPQSKHLSGKTCLVLDLDETLVHSSFKYLKGADFVLPVDIDDQIHNVYVMKRPGVDEFLKKVGSLFEVVIFTASVARYGDPLLDILDKHNSVHHILFREACYNYEGNYIKNLSQIGRPLSEIIILDNSPASYIFHPQHAIPISSWFSDTHDNELLDIIPLLEDLSEQSVPDVGKVLDITI
ncbi:hypothetical protein ZYGR_0AG04420 [Zygosaccharomyces rouxii]|uniref:FCP1 homology domain-containing protein n=1 Tax=Zygosaccharomyces rouxii TaxID=4956 RepID=A0A1Q3A9Z0_ZYGRO|nr:hypothetical protein ZYGR_0AG04420 [Zygosaccharomyces rouxii]